MRKSSTLARPPTCFGFTDGVDGTEELDDVDSQQEQTGYATNAKFDKNRLFTTYPKQKNHSSELLDIEQHNIRSGLTQHMVNLTLSDAPDMSSCRKLPDYPSLTFHADCMWHRTNR